MRQSSAFLIRDAVPADRDALVAVAAAAYEQYSHLLPQAFWERYRQSLLERVGTADDAQRIVAEVQGSIAGFVLLYPAAAVSYAAAATTATGAAARSWPEIRLLAVDPTMRGQGIGKILIMECLARARRAGAHSIGLHTMDVMAVAQQMYERMGFAREPATDFTPMPGLVVKGYRLDLTPDTALHQYEAV